MLRSLVGLIKQNRGISLVGATGRSPLRAVLCGTGARRWAVDFVLLVALTVLFRAAMVQAGGGDAGRCAQTGVTDAYQPHASELSSVFEAAGSNSLGPNYANLGTMWAGMGANQQLVPATVPCVILKSIGYVESAWQQAYGTPPGLSGLPNVSPSCGYGIMQITSGMTYPGALDPTTQQRIAREYIYNVSYGAKMLVDKWNWTPAVGNNNPNVLEDWYYAVWAYNSFSWKNNPNNYDPNRPPFDGTQDRRLYPYQELVFGFIAYPPLMEGAVRWNPVPVTLPPSYWINDPPGAIPDPQPIHDGACSGSPPPTPTPTPLPNLSASPSFMGFLAEPGNSTAPQTLRISGDRGPILNWSLQSSSSGWLSASPTGGNTSPANVSVSAATASLPTGRYQGSITVQNLSKPGQTSVISISAYVGPIHLLRFPTIFRMGSP